MKSLAWIAAGGLVCLAGAADAQTRAGWQVGVAAFDYSYREKFDDAQIQDDGVFIGAGASYTWVRGRWNLAVAVEGAMAEVDYRFESERLDDVRQIAVQSEITLGRDLRLANGAIVTPFVGLGSRRLLDMSGGLATNEGSLGYDRQIDYHYVPIGLRVLNPLDSGDHLMVSAQYNALTGGQSKAYFSDLSPEIPNVAFDFNGGGGFEASVAWTRAAPKGLASVGPYVRRWKIDRSDSWTVTEDGETLELYEPANSTWEVGLRLRFNL